MEYCSAEAAARTMETLEGLRMLGRRMHINYAIAKKKENQNSCDDRKCT